MLSENLQKELESLKNKLEGIKARNVSKKEHDEIKNNILKIEEELDLLDKESVKYFDKATDNIYTKLYQKYLDISEAFKKPISCLNTRLNEYLLRDKKAKELLSQAKEVSEKINYLETLNEGVQTLHFISLCNPKGFQEILSEILYKNDINLDDILESSEDKTDEE